MRDQIKPIIIFSVDQASCTQDENEVSRMWAELHLAGIDYKKLLGSYNGKEETSYLVIDNEKTRKVVTELAYWNKQESILISNESRQCQLLFIDSGLTHSIGKLVAIDKRDVEQYDAWSYDADNDQYYTCK